MVGCPGRRPRNPLAVATGGSIEVSWRGPAGLWDRIRSPKAEGRIREVPTRDRSSSGCIRDRPGTIWYARICQSCPSERWLLCLRPRGLLSRESAGRIPVRSARRGRVVRIALPPCRSHARSSLSPPTPAAAGIESDNAGRSRSGVVAPVPSAPAGRAPPRRLSTRDPRPRARRGDDRPGPRPLRQCRRLPWRARR